MTENRFKMAAFHSPSSTTRGHQGHAHFRLLRTSMAALGTLLLSEWVRAMDSEAREGPACDPALPVRAVL